ncbi:hypothetical protein [Kitasatospora sp. NPDC048538]|uniref:hypothetical protein n=1 Tax=unclassified Kitasatospora TaxID=2633591 RepID=UPI0033C34347
MTSQLPRGIQHLIPTAPTTTAGERAASQLLHLRTATVPVPVLAAAVELLAELLASGDPATRAAAADVRARLLASIGDAAPPATGPRPRGA